MWTSFFSSFVLSALICHWPSQKSSFIMGIQIWKIYNLE